MNIDGNTPVLSEDEMRGLGFTDHTPEHWYYTARVCSNISFNLTIEKSTGNYEEYVLDEFILQPYHYRTYDAPGAREAEVGVDREIARLREAGLDVTVDHEAYDLRKG